jgi:hypothetical protein
MKTTSIATPSTTMRVMPIIHLNGFPGTGKLTIARELVDMLNSFPDALVQREKQSLNAAKLVHNHLLINPADSVLHRTQTGYQRLRKAIRDAVFTTLTNEKETHGTTYVFTDWQSGDDIGTQVCEDFSAMSRSRGCEFIPIIITCDKEENARRITNDGRTRWSKVTDSDQLLQWRQQMDPPPVYEFHGHEKRLEIDVTKLSAKQAAETILRHVSRYVRLR